MDASRQVRALHRSGQHQMGLFVARVRDNTRFRVRPPIRRAVARRVDQHNAFADSSTASMNSWRAGRGKSDANDGGETAQFFVRGHAMGSTERMRTDCRWARHSRIAILINVVVLPAPGGPAKNHGGIAGVRIRATERPRKSKLLANELRGKPRRAMGAPADRGKLAAQT